MFFLNLSEKKKRIIKIPKNKELIQVPIPLKKIMEFIPSFIPLKMNQF